MKHIVSIVIYGLLIACNNKPETFKKESFQAETFHNCNNTLTPVVEVWNHNGKGYIIGNWGDKKDIYVKSNGWNSTNNPFPKAFDLKLKVINNDVLYDNPTPSLNPTSISLYMKLRVGENDDAIYPLNSKLVENVTLIKDKLITKGSFKNEDNINVWVQNIPIEPLYIKYKKTGLNINQLVFYITFNSEGSHCEYQYAFHMSGEAEP